MDIHALIDHILNNPQYLKYLAYGFVGWLGYIVFRFIVIWLMRLSGVYSPNQYHLWPRFPWRPFYAISAIVARWHEFVFLFGKRGHTGGFASWIETLSMLHKPHKLHLGRASAFGLGLMQSVGINIKRHLLIVAQTGSGKTTALATMVSCWKNSVYIVDPKAQLIEALAEYDYRQWFVFDPSNISSIPSISINFFDCIQQAVERDGEDAYVLWASRIAEAIIVTPSGVTAPYFYEVSRNFLSGLILHVISMHEEHEHNLPFVRDLIVHGYRVFNDEGKEETQDEEAQALLLKMMSENPSFDGFVSGAVSALQSASSETSGNVWSTLKQQSQFLDLPNVRRCLRESDISLSDLKIRNDIVLAFCASIYSIREELSGLNRLLTNMIAYTFESEKRKNGQCLMICDELPSQKYNSTIEVMLAIARSMGLTVVAVCQNIEQLRQHYRDSYKSFLGEADACLWMGANHPENADLLSKILGKKTLRKIDPRTGKVSQSVVDVMTPEQAKRYLDPDSDRMIATLTGRRSVRLLNDPYYKALPVWQYKADPEYGDTLFRRLIRGILNK